MVSEPLRIERYALGCTLTPSEVLRLFRHRHRLVSFVGSWALGEAIIGFDPIRELTERFELSSPPTKGPGLGGGWMGVWDYDGGHAVGFYDLVLCLRDGQWWVESLGAVDPQRLDDIRRTLQAPPPAPTAYAMGSFTFTPTPQEHQGSVARAVAHITAGDVFQVNLCARLDASFAGDPLDVFCRGVELLRPAFGAYVSRSEGAVVSFSPELFLRRTGRAVLTSPIKGTAELTTDPQELVASAKNRAENIMITDLMRNDLGRVAVPGSVRVPALVRPERHAVWQLVSDVVAELEPGLDDKDLLQATFPPGSITGAPKVRAMQLIDELEPVARGAYTGAMGYVGCDAMELNVAIRTFEFSTDAAGQQRVALGVGGGIVADSDPHDEYAECLVKARPLIDAVGGELPYESTSDRQATAASGPRQGHDELEIAKHGVFETVLVRSGEPVNLDAHLARLAESVRALWGRSIPASLRSDIDAEAANLTGPHRLRIDATPEASGVNYRLHAAVLTSDPGPWRLEPVELAGGLGAHKWIDRRRLEVGGDVEPLLIDTDGSVLETARANVFVVLDDGLHTPRLDGRLLPGTMREQIIARAALHGLSVHQRRLTLEDLRRADEVFVTNALRGVVPVSSIRTLRSYSSRRVATLLGQPARTEQVAQKSTSERARVLFIDNYDSFVFNLVQYVREFGAEAEVLRNDDPAGLTVEPGDFTHLVISPGPGRPSDAGISADMVSRLGPTTATLGVCLGHQVIAEVYGATVERAPVVVHGKSSLVHHDCSGVLAGLPTPLACGRYHSLSVVDLPAVLRPTAWTADNVLMAMRHVRHPIEGVQFHPESILTSHGHAMIANFLSRSA